MAKDFRQCRTRTGRRNHWTYSMATTLCGYVATSIKPNRGTPGRGPWLAAYDQAPTCRRCDHGLEMAAESTTEFWGDSVTNSQTANSGSAVNVVRKVEQG